MDKFQEILVREFESTNGIAEASVLISEVRFTLKNADATPIRCRIWYKVDKGEYRYDLSHARPGMLSSHTDSAGSPEAALHLALERLMHGYGASTGGEVRLVKNTDFDDRN